MALPACLRMNIHTYRDKLHKRQMSGGRNLFFGFSFFLLKRLLPLDKNLCNFSRFLSNAIRLIFAALFFSF